MNKKQKVAIVATVFIAVLLICSALFLNKGKDQTKPENNEVESQRMPTSNDTKLNTLVPDNTVLANSDWFDDNNAPLIFVDGEHFVWYKTKDMQKENAISGTYETYYEVDAYKSIDGKYFNSENELPDSNEDSIVLKLTALEIKNDGENTIKEPNTKTLMGNLGVEVLSLMDMDSAMLFNLTAEQKLNKEEVNIEPEEVIKDIVYSENTDAWKSLELKVEGLTLSYPYSANILKKAGLSYNENEVDKDNGYVLLKTKSGNDVVATFANKLNDELSSMTIRRYSNINVVLPNGITWGSSEEEVLKAYGKPNEVARGSVNEKIYRYNLEESNLQLELYIFTEDCLYGTASGVELISINNFINKG